MVVAIQEEKLMKHWPRQWKLNLVFEFIPDWDDLWNLISV